MEEIKGIQLDAKVEVTRLISDFYYEMQPGFGHSGGKHAGWEFVYVESGKVRVWAEDATYILKKGEMVCHKPYEYHNIRPHEGPAGIIVLCFASPSAYMRYFNNKIISVNQLQKHCLNQLVALGEKLFEPRNPLEIVTDGAMDRSASATDLQEQFAKSAVEFLLLSLMDSQVTEKKDRICLYEQFHRRQTLAEDIMEYLNTHIGETVNLEEIARHFSYSLSSIKRIFKEVNGRSIMACLIDLRMRQARTMLTETDLSIEKIAEKVGYSNVYYFSTAFKKYWGTPPARCRLENRK